MFSQQPVQFAQPITGNHLQEVEAMVKASIKKVIGYVRISSEGQKENTSIQEQIKRITAYCVSQNWQLVQTFCDEAKSASCTDERKAYQDMLEYAKSKENGIDAIIVFKSDRIHRHLKNLLIMIEDELEPSDIAFVSVSENFDTSSPQGMLTLQMLGSFAEFERNMINERTRSGRMVTARLGKYAGGKIPYGYMLQDEQVVVNDAEAHIIKQIYRMYLEGKSYAYIAELLNMTQNDELDNSGSSEKSTSKQWSRTSICYMLRNATYTGIYSYNGKKERNNLQSKTVIPAIISKQQFNKVQRMRNDKKAVITQERIIGALAD
jgi:DNA invertase Pin-like site-specific DNA recombinase